jgi:hypothetical protein
MVGMELCLLPCTQHASMSVMVRFTVSCAPLQWTVTAHGARVRTEICTRGWHFSRAMAVVEGSVRNAEACDPARLSGPCAMGSSIHPRLCRACDLAARLSGWRIFLAAPPLPPWILPSTLAFLFVMLPPWILCKFRSSTADASAPASVWMQQGLTMNSVAHPHTLPHNIAGRRLRWLPCGCSKG